MPPRDSIIENFHNPENDDGGKIPTPKTMEDWGRTLVDTSKGGDGKISLDDIRPVGKMMKTVKPSGVYPYIEPPFSEDRQRAWDLIKRRGSK